MARRGTIGSEATVFAALAKALLGAYLGGCATRPATLRAAAGRYGTRGVPEFFAERFLDLARRNALDMDRVADHRRVYVPSGPRGISRPLVRG